MIQAHQVAPADLAALATGRGDGAVVGGLASGQLTRRLLRLRALMAAAQELPADATAAMYAGYELAAAVQQNDPGSMAEVLLYPSVGAWSAICLRRLRGSEAAARPLGADLGHLAAIAAAAAALAREDFEIRVPVVGGTVMLPSMGMACFENGAGHDAVVRGSGGQLELVANGRAVAVPDDPAADGRGWRGLRRLRATAGGDVLVVALDDIDPFRAGHDLPSRERIAAADVPCWERTLTGAWDVLVSHHPWYADAIKAGLVSLVPLAGRSARDSMSATSRDTFGACALSEPADAQSLAVTLVHEFQHAKLGALHDIVPLYGPGPDVRYYSPWRDDPRPVSGLLQGAYAYLGIVDFWRTLRRAGISGQFGNPMFAHFEFARWREQTLRAMDVIERSGRLTRTGQELLAGMRDRIGQWREEPVPDEPNIAARGAIDDHRLSWRLRNLDADRHEVGRLASAWLARVAPGPVGGESTVIQSGRALTRNPRLDLLCLRLKDPPQFASLCSRYPDQAPGGISDGDIAYAKGDMSAAAHHYRELIGVSPDRKDAWAGLAVTGDWPPSSAMTQCPELVYALHRRIRQLSTARPDPADLAAWLKSGRW